MHFVKESRIAAAPSAVFAFHESRGALERLTPPWEQVELVEGGDSIRPGSRVVLKVKLRADPDALGGRAHRVRTWPALCGSAGERTVCKLVAPSPLPR